jgi:hypothetical protein
MCLNSKVYICKNLSDVFPVQNSPKQDVSSPLLFSSALEYSIMKVQENQEKLELNKTHQFITYADNVNSLGENRNTINKNKEALLEAGRKAGLELNMHKKKKLHLTTKMQDKIIIY